MTTFSQLVDSVIAESRRPDLRTIIENQLNLTMRELHADAKTGLALRYGANLVELSIQPDTEPGYTWTIPNPHLFQNLEAVYYPLLGVAPKLRNPGSAMAYLQNPDGQFYFYRTGDAYAFAGYGGVEGLIYLAYYARLRRLKYLSPAQRLVTWDIDAQDFVFADSIAGDEEEQQAALQAETNWMLMRHEDLLAQGVRSKVYARLGDQNRSRLAYSLYESLRPGMVSAESFEFVPTWNR